MPPSEAGARSTIIATYSTRRDADVAHDYLDDADIETFVSSDDAGGMHPQMQRPNGVKLVGMSETAQRARRILDEADLLPEARGDSSSALGKNKQTTNGTPSSPSGWLFAGVAIVIVALFILGMLFIGST